MTSGTPDPNAAAVTSRVESILAQLFLIAVALVVTIVFAEVLSRVYITRFATDEQFLRYASEKQLDARFGADNSKFVRHIYLGTVPRPAWVNGANRHNALGFRGEEFPVAKRPGEFRIVCLGGSTTYTSAVDDYRLSYPAQLETRLREQYPNVRVINGGVPAWTTWETLIGFETRVLDLSPDLIIVLHAINDFEMRLVWPPDAYRGDNSGGRTAPSGDKVMDGILEHSTIARYLLIRTGRIQPHSRLEQMMRRPATSLLRTLRGQLRQRTYPAAPFDRIPLERVLRENPPVYFRRNLEHLIALAERHGTKVVLMTMATAPVNVDRAFASAIDSAGIDEMNEVTRDVAARERVPLFDLARQFPKEERLFVDGVHVNAEGARLRAEQVANFLQSARLLPDGAPPGIASTARR